MFGRKNTDHDEDGVIDAADRDGRTRTRDTSIDTDTDRDGHLRSREIIDRDALLADRDQDALVVARDRFGGADPAAQFGGMLAALGATVFLAGMVAAATNFGYQFGLDTGSTEDLTVGGFLAGAAVLFAALLLGGWVAGRMARYDGARNGFFAGLWFLLILAMVAAIGAWIDESYNFLDEVRLPDWIRDDLTTAAAVSAVALAALCLLASTLGGGIGSRYHRQPDGTLLSHRTLVGRSARRDEVVDDDVTTIRDRNEAEVRETKVRDRDDTSYEVRGTPVRDRDRDLTS